METGASSSQGSLWISGMKWDLFWFFSILWTFPLTFFGSYFLTDGKLPHSVFLTVMVYSGFHICLPIVFALVLSRKMSEMNDRRIPKSFWAVVATVVALSSIGIYGPSLLTIVIPTVSAIWATWHFYRQDLGVLSMYRQRQGVKCETLIRLDRAACVFFSLINPIQYWTRLGLRFTGVSGHFDLTIFEKLIPWRGVYATGIGLFSVYLFFQMRNRSPFCPRSLYVCGLFLQFLTMTPLILFPPFTEYLIRRLSHSSIEIGLQAKMWKMEFSRGSSLRRLGWSVVAVVIITFAHIYIGLKYPFIVVINDNGFFDWQEARQSAGTVMTVALISIYLGIFWGHYYIGRHVYNFSNPYLRPIFESMPKIDLMSLRPIRAPDGGG